MGYKMIPNQSQLFSRSGGASPPSPGEMPIINPIVNPHQVVNIVLTLVGKLKFMDSQRAWPLRRAEGTENPHYY